MSLKINVAYETWKKILTYLMEKNDIQIQIFSIVII